MPPKGRILYGNSGPEEKTGIRFIVRKCALPVANSKSPPVAIRRVVIGQVTVRPHRLIDMSDGLAETIALLEHLHEPGSSALAAG